MNYYSADKIHDGYKFLPANSVIEADNQGKIIALSTINEVPEEKIKHFKGILCPGLVNAHCHIELSHLKGLIPKHTGLTNFVKQIPSLRKTLSEAQKKQAALDAITAMKKNGIVAVGDIANNTDTLPLRENSDLHIHSFVECIGFNKNVAQNNFIFSENILQQFQENDTSKSGKILSQSIAPHAPYSISMELLQLINKNQTTDVLSIHNQETEAENEYFIAKTGKLKELYNHLKIDDTHFNPTGKSSLQSILPYFDKKHSLILVHNTFTEKGDIEALKQSEISVHFCLCPNANLYIENQLPDVALLISSGINICLGTDSLASNDELNIVSEIKSLQSAFPQISLEMLLSMATINGAKALQMENLIGSFTAGKVPGINWIKEDDSIEKVV